MSHYGDLIRVKVRRNERRRSLASDTVGFRSRGADAHRVRHSENKCVKCFRKEEVP
jgi:hypothetical protein